MITYSGRSVWPHNTSEEGVPTDVAPSLEDIAVGLGRQSRFAGQTRVFYTVLCHSLVAGQLTREFRPGQDELRRHLLVHDGHEAVLSDTPTTWKNIMTRDDEADLDERIRRELGLRPLTPDEKLDLKMIDYACLAAEAHALGHIEAEKWWPAADFGKLEQRAYALTMGQINAGNTIGFLTPENAIRALTRALAS